MGLTADVKLGVVAAALDPVHVARGHVAGPSPQHHREPIQVPGRPAPRDAGTRPVQRARQPLLVERLEQVVHRGRVERLHRVLGVRGNEDDVRHGRQVQALDQREPVRARHADVEQNQVRPLRAGEVARLLHVLRLAHDLHVRVAGQHLPQALPREGLVIHQQHAHQDAPSSRVPVM